MSVCSDGRGDDNDVDRESVDNELVVDDVKEREDRRMGSTNFDIMSRRKADSRADRESGVSEQRMAGRVISVEVGGTVDRLSRHLKVCRL